MKGKIKDVNYVARESKTSSKGEMSICTTSRIPKPPKKVITKDKK